MSNSIETLRKEDKILSFLEELRDSFHNAERVFTYGSCFRLYRILKVLWPESECWYDGNHAITKIGDKFYDINGEFTPYRHIPLDQFYGKDGQETCFSLRYGEPETILL